MLKDSRGGSQYHLSVNRREACYKLCDYIKKRQPEWKGASKSTRKMGKGSHKVFNTVVKDILYDLLSLGESGS